MPQATEMAKVTARGGFHLLWGIVISTVISSLGTIAIAYFLGADNMGLYYVAINAPNLIATFRDWGVNTAMVRYSAQYNHQNDTAKIRSIFVSGLAFELVLGLILTLISITISGYLAEAFQRPAIGQLIQITSLVILTGALMNTATAAFTGMERMHLNSIMLIVQSIIKTALIIGLVVLGLGTLGAVTGMIIAVLVAGIVGLAFMYTMYRSLQKPADGKLSLIENIKALLKYGLPISIGSILTGFLTQYYTYILAIFVAVDALIGNYSVATNFVVLITFFATPVTTMLLPAFSKLDYKKDQAVLKNVFQYSVKYAALIVIPVTALVIVLAQPAIGTIYGNEYTDAPLFLALLSIAYLFTALGNLSIGNLINSQGDTKFNLKMNLLTVVIGFPLSTLLISQFGTIGLIVTTLIVGIPGLLWSLVFISKRYGVSVDWMSSAKILFSSTVAAVITYLVNVYLPFSDPIELIIGCFVFIIVFLPVALFTQTINKTDIGNVREIVGGLGPLRKPLTIIINMIEKLMPKSKKIPANQTSAT
ncbi:MAG TPA: oligosaccharide flippase family protein [Candidatus Acidoferrales bacterium]|nr:oligosaccharide flippase family protein [Candidatus Acidoferrales bacterium]